MKSIYNLLQTGGLSIDDFYKKFIKNKIHQIYLNNKMKNMKNFINPDKISKIINQLLNTLDMININPAVSLDTVKEQNLINSLKQIKLQINKEGNIFKVKSLSGLENIILEPDSQNQIDNKVDLDNEKLENLIKSYESYIQNLNDYIINIKEINEKLKNNIRYIKNYYKSNEIYLSNEYENYIDINLFDMNETPSVLTLDKLTDLEISIDTDEDDKPDDVDILLDESMKELFKEKVNLKGLVKMPKKLYEKEISIPAITGGLLNGGIFISKKEKTRITKKLTNYFKKNLDTYSDILKQKQEEALRKKLENEERLRIEKEKREKLYNKNENIISNFNLLIDNELFKNNLDYLNSLNQILKEEDQNKLKEININFNNQKIDINNISEEKIEQIHLILNSNLNKIEENNFENIINQMNLDFKNMEIDNFMKKYDKFILNKGTKNLFNNLNLTEYLKNIKKDLRSKKKIIQMIKDEIDIYQERIKWNKNKRSKKK